MKTLKERVTEFNETSPHYYKLDYDYINTYDIPKKYHSKELSNFIGYEQVRDKIDIEKIFNLEKSLYFFGNNGGGKTHLTYALKKEIVLYYKLHPELGNINIEVINDRDFFQDIKVDYKLQNEYKSRILKADLVIWEEWGKEKVTENTSGLMAAIINRADDNEKPKFICNTTIPPEDITDHEGKILCKGIAKRFNDGADIFDRMRDIFLNGFIELNNKSGRG